MSYRAMFSSVGSICKLHEYTFKKISNVLTNGKSFPKCVPNCVSLHNGHKCVIGDQNSSGVGGRRFRRRFIIDRGAEYELQ